MMKPEKKLKQKKGPQSYPLLGEYPAKSRFAESYRNLRTNIHFSFVDKSFQTLLITSAGEKEGKTLSIANLAYTMAQAGWPVLVIDADLRKPVLSNLMASGYESPGLTGLLVDIFGTKVREGTLADFYAGDLLRLLALQKKTGFLHLSQNNEKVRLSFLQGELVDVDWITRPEEKKLAKTLIKNRLITHDQIKQAMSRQKDTGQKLGFILIHTGLLKKEDLTGPLTIHMMEGLRTALQMKTGSFHFKEMLESDFDRSSFDPVDFHQLYRQLRVGEEEIPYLQEKIFSAIVDTGTENLFLLPSGSLPPNPAELLSSDRMSFLLSNLKKRFDVILIDSPPILPASDALLIAPHVDGVLMVTRAGVVNRELVRKAVDNLKVARANIIGVVLNNVDTKRAGYYMYYHKYYSKYYGEDE